MNVYDKLIHCTNQVKDRIDVEPKVGIVLGSGLGALADRIENPTVIPYAEIDGFPTSTAPGHVGAFVVGQLDGVDVILMKGRIHLYEGYPVEDCVLPVRLMGQLGIKVLLLTNAAGAANTDYSIGDFVALKDHISVLVPSPLMGKNIDELGTRFPDMTEVYNKEVRKLIVDCVTEAGGQAREGVYMQFSGPAYETPAEIRLAQSVGADMCGMSTVVEAIAAHHMQIPRIGAISLATNMAAGLGGKLDEQEVIDQGKLSGETFQKIVEALLVKLDEQGYLA